MTTATPSGRGRWPPSFRRHHAFLDLCVRLRSRVRRCPSRVHQGEPQPCVTQPHGQLGQGASLVEARSSIGDAGLLAMDASGQPSQPLPWDRGGCVHKGYEVKADVSP